MNKCLEQCTHYIKDKNQSPAQFHLISVALMVKQSPWDDAGNDDGNDNSSGEDINENNDDMHE